jgi:hypothetical protein
MANTKFIWEGMDPEDYLKVEMFCYFCIVMIEQEGEHDV